MNFKIVSRGQTGVDRAGLEAAIALGLPYGGWVPKGRLAEDGTVPLRYAGMQEHRATMQFVLDFGIIHGVGTQ